MGTTLELPPGVLGIADGVFFPKSLLNPLSPGEGTKREINDQQRAGEKSRKVHIHYSSYTDPIS